MYRTVRTGNENESEWSNGTVIFRSDRSDREKRTTSKGGPVFSKLFRLDRTDPLSFGPKFPEILVEWIAPHIMGLVFDRIYEHAGKTVETCKR